MLLASLALAGCDSDGLTDGAAVARGQLSSDGGTLCLQGVCVEAPAGALAANAEVTVRTFTGDAGVPALGPVYDLEVSGEGFGAPVTLRLPLPTGHTADSVTVFSASNAESLWSPVPSRATADGHGVELATEHFSLWALVPNSSIADFVSSLAYDPSGRLYALEARRGRVLRYDDGRLMNPRAITSIGGASLVNASAIAVDAQQQLYVLSNNAFRGVWRTDDRPGSTPAFSDLGGLLTRKFGYGLSLRPDGSIVALFTADIAQLSDFANTSPVSPATVPSTSGCRRRMVTSPGDNRLTGTPIYLEWCMRFHQPLSAAFDREGRTYIADADIGAVVRINDFATPQWDSYIERVSPSAYRAYSPIALGFDPQQRLVIAYSNSVVRLDDFSGAGRTVLWSGNQRISTMAVGPRGELALAFYGANTPMRVDECPDDPDKLLRGFCGCGMREDPTDSDRDGVPDCADTSPMQGCDCFNLAEVQRARAEVGARCVNGGPMTRRTTGVTRTENGGTFLVGAEERSGDFFCAAGCQTNCGASTERTLRAEAYEACRNIAQVGCGL